MKMQFNRSLTKYVLLCLLFTASFSAKAQFSTVLGNFRTYNNTAITTKTGAKSITPINVGGNIDSTARYLLWLNTLIGAATGLQGTLNAGNTASTTAGGTSAIVLQDPVSSNGQNTIDYGQLHYQTGIKNNILLSSGFSISQPSLRMYDYISGNYVSVAPPNLGGTVNVTWPAQSGVLVTQITPLQFTVGSSSSTGAQVQSTSLVINNTGTMQAELGVFSTIPLMSLKDRSSAFNSVIVASPLSASRLDSFPDQSGTFALVNNFADITTGNRAGNFTTIDSVYYGFTPSGSAFTSKLYSGYLRGSRADSLPDRSGDIALNGVSTAPTIASTGAALGTAPTVTLSGTSNDVCGTITAVCGTTPATGGILFSLLWGQAYTGKTPVVQFTPANSNAAGLPLFGSGSSTSATASIQTGATALTAGNTYIFTYRVQY